MHKAARIEEVIDRAGARLLQRTQRSRSAVEVYEDDRYRWLQNDNGTLQSLMDRRSPERLLLPYTAAMMAGLLFIDTPRSVLMLGLGGASQARFLQHHFADTRITAWESDPEIIAIARRHFCLPDKEGMRIINEDARTGVTRDAPAADLILLDLFGADGLPPWLREKPIHESCHRLLHEHGVLAANLWVDPDDEFLQVMTGVQKAFDKRILVFGVPGYRNLVVLAFKDTPCLDFASLYERATSLADHTGLDYAEMLNTMRESNDSNENGFVLYKGVGDK